MHFWFFMVENLILWLESLVANSTVKLWLLTLFVILVVRFSLINVILFVIFFNFSESFFLELSFDFFHLLFLLFLLLKFFLPFFFLPLFFLSLGNQVLLVSQVSLFDKTHQILDSLNVVFSLLGSFFCVLLLHSALYPSVLGITSIIPFTPSECLVCGEVLPIFIKLNYFLCCCSGSTEPFKFSHLFF